MSDSDFSINETISINFFPFIDEIFFLTEMESVPKDLLLAPRNTQKRQRATSFMQHKRMLQSIQVMNLYGTM